MDCARRELVELLCHEIGNLLAGVRLLGAAGDAEAAASAARAAARAGALLALIPPLVAGSAAATGPAPAEPLEVLGALRRLLDADEDARVRIALAGAVRLPPVALAPGLLHDLLLAQLFAALDAADGPVLVAAEADAGALRFRIEAPAPRRAAGGRGNALARAAAAAILAAHGGAVEPAAEGEAGVVLRVPLRAAEAR